MKKRFLYPGLFFLAILGEFYSHPLREVRAASLADGKTLVLYDASSGAIPSESLMDFTDFPPGAASLTYASGSTVLDTTLAGNDTYAGWVSSQAITTGFPILDRAGNFQVNFTLQVESEAHDRNNRSGFSVIILDQDAKGIELSFWENEIWAQNDDLTGRPFTHGEGIAFPTTTELTEYQVTVAGDTYTLTANSEPILSGPVRDYGRFDGFPDPYETPNFLFWGDDTTAAQARVRLGFVSVSSTQPTLPTVTVTGTSTSSSMPTASFTPPPSATPVPSPTPVPVGRVFDLCPSGWLFIAITLPNVMLLKKLRRRSVSHS